MFSTVLFFWEMIDNHLEYCWTRPFIQMLQTVEYIDFHYIFHVQCTCYIWCSSLSGYLQISTVKRLQNECRRPFTFWRWSVRRLNNWFCFVFFGKPLPRQNIATAWPAPLLDEELTYKPRVTFDIWRKLNTLSAYTAGRRWHPGRTTKARAFDRRHKHKPTIIHISCSTKYRWGHGPDLKHIHRERETGEGLVGNCVRVPAV